MATLKFTMIRGREHLINLDVVKYLAPAASGGSIVHFLDGTSLHVEETPETLAKLAPVAYSPKVLKPEDSS